MMTAFSFSLAPGNTVKQLDAVESCERLYFLDWVRIFAFCLLIFYHVGMYYVTWYWHIKSDAASSTIEPLMFLTNPWRMGLLFMISGVATRFMLGKQTTKSFASARSLRILLPLVFGMAVIVPPQAYLEVVQRLGYAGSYSDFLNLYFQNYQGFMIEGKRLVLPTWNHLWFLPYLWVYSMLIAAFVASAPRFIVWLDQTIEKKFRGIWIVVLPVSYLAMVRISMLSNHPQTNNLTNDWYNHASYLFLFLCGFFLAKQNTFWQGVAQKRWRSAVIAGLGWVFLVSYFSYFNDSNEPSQLMLYIQRAVWIMMAWNAILALCGFARQHWNIDHPLRQHLTQAVFPVYILHQTLIVILAWNMRAWHLPAGIEAFALIGLCFAFCWVGFECIRRIPLLRPFFGMPWKEQDKKKAITR
ncbi:acyltransferase [Undibacterium sp. LX40W]|uniref:Acyltransferase n=1 Tax=Undibacterium nitidum TaxID=2762298 RepID=A0A923HRW7_9BURK|nr:MULTISPECIES: acyltransferase [Undibacterium]MBC3882833.1 acyltransferase [Undibacterium nitidum]MBC3892984.1 acyltransferase [Undibacterium sp. LX40W]